MVHLDQMDAGLVEFLVRYGWSMTDSGLTPKLMTQAAAPKELTELTVCQCHKSKCACKCVKAGLLCSPTCGCESDSGLCENTVSLEENMFDDSSESDYD